MKYAEKWGDSVDAAVALALQDLGLTKDQVNVTILEEPSKGFFGIGSKLAKVRVEEKAEEKPEKPAKPEKAEKPEVKASFRETRRDSKPEKFDSFEAYEKAHASDPKEEDESEESRPKKEHRRRERRERRAKERNEALDQLNQRPENLVEAPEHPAQVFLTELFRDMDLNVNVKTFTGDKVVFIDVDGPDSGSVIGKRGTTLDAVQYLTSLVVNKDENGYIRVVINAEGYRERREQTLERLANKLADKAARTGKSIRLEPMNPYERKVIHTALQKRSEIFTRSEGEEPYRKVVIVPSKKH